MQEVSSSCNRHLKEMIKMNTSTTLIFDSLEYFEKLKSVGVPDAQAKVQAEAMRRQSEIQASAYEALRNELATKADIQLEIEKLKNQILKWIIGIAILGFGTVLSVMARGFHWI